MVKIGAGGDLKCAREGLLKCNLVLVCRTFAIWRAETQQIVSTEDQPEIKITLVNTSMLLKE